MRVRFIRGTALGGEANAYPGDVLDLPSAQAAALVAAGRAAALPDDSPAPAPAAPAAPVAAEPEAAPRRSRARKTKD